MIRLASRLLLFVAVFFVASCEEEMIGLAEGTASSLTVNVYVDSDGDGALSQGDMSVGGGTVDLVGPVELTAQVANGTAQFSGLQPGTYQLSLSGANPDGATLVTASNPVVVAPFQGDDLSAEFRYSFFPGEISGRLFRDDNGSGSFEAAEDTPAAGVVVSLFSGSSGSGASIGTTATASDGAFSFSTLRPGSYSLTFEAPPSVMLVGGDVQPVTVIPDTEVPLDVTFTGSFLISIQEAREASVGDPVTVEGVVTFAPPFLGFLAFIQDETAGITLVGVDDFVSDLEPGDVVRVTGLRDEFFSEVQIGDLTSLEVVGSQPVPEPRRVVAAEINDGLFQGELALNEGVVQMVQLFGEDQLVTLEGVTGELFNVFVDADTGVGSETWTMGETFTVTGILGIDTRDDLPFRIEVRGPEDVMEGSRVVTVAEARGMVDQTATIRGVVSRKESWDEDDGFVQDGSGGIFVAGALADAEPGDLVEITGPVSQEFGNELQMEADGVAVLGSPGAPAPVVATGAQVLAGSLQGVLVQVTGTVQTVEIVNSFGTQVVTVMTGDGSELEVFSDNRTGLFESSWTVGQTVTVVGPVGRFFDPQIEIMQASDVTFGT